MAMQTLFMPVVQMRTSAAAVVRKNRTMIEPNETQPAVTANPPICPMTTWSKQWVEHADEDCEGRGDEQPGADVVERYVAFACEHDGVDREREQRQKFVLSERDDAH